MTPIPPDVLVKAAADVLAEYQTLFFGDLRLNAERAAAKAVAAVFATPEMTALIEAAWMMCVEQQHHPAEGWSMAKSWAWDQLNHAIKPFRLKEFED